MITRSSSARQNVETAVETVQRDILSVKPASRWIWSIILAILLLLVGLLAYAYFIQQNNRGNDALHSFSPTGKPVQIDVLNGCGVLGVASKFTTFLRHQGFDVVEMRNYKSFDIQETLVIDRVGNLTLARNVATALGVSPRNVIQEINSDYFVDVSIVIGKDYQKFSFMNNN